MHALAPRGQFYKRARSNIIIILLFIFWIGGQGVRFLLFVAALPPV